MEENRTAPQEFFFTPTNDDDLISLPPSSRHLRYGDSLIISANQCAEFRCGGRKIPFREPGVFCIGFDRRTPEEIMLSAMVSSADSEQQLLMLNTSVVFCDLSPRMDCLCKMNRDVMFTPAVGMCPEFVCTLRVDPDHADKAISYADRGGRLIDLALPEIARQLCRRISAMCTYYEQNTMEDIARELNDAQSDIEDALNEQAAECVLQKYGLLVEDIQIRNWGLHSGYCSECGARVEDSPFRRVTRCVNGHPQYHCPKCSELLYGPKMHKRCLFNGDPVVFCEACETYVNAPDGKCSIHG